MDGFDAQYWHDHWSAADVDTSTTQSVNPYLSIETQNLPVGTVLDAGCGTGAEAVWLAQHHWKVTAVDISSIALGQAREREAAALPTAVEWLEADLAQWQPNRAWDLVYSSYAHARVGQLALYRRLASWVAPGGTLLIVGHRHEHPHGGIADHQPPAEATTKLADVVSLFHDSQWQVDSAFETTRTAHHGGQAIPLNDVVVRAHRNA